MCRIFNIFKKKVTIIEPIHIEQSTVVFDVNRFNTWFNEPDNGAVYAHSGIFLRTDKLSLHHIHEYIRNTFNKETYQFYELKESECYQFKKSIIADWKLKK